MTSPPPPPLKDDQEWNESKVVMRWSHLTWGHLILILIIKNSLQFLLVSRLLLLLFFGHLSSPAAGKYTGWKLDFQIMQSNASFVANVCRFQQQDRSLICSRSSDSTMAAILDVLIQMSFSQMLACKWMVNRWHTFGGTGMGSLH